MARNFCGGVAWTRRGNAARQATNILFAPPLWLMTGGAPCGRKGGPAAQKNAAIVLEQINAVVRGPSATGGTARVSLWCHSGCSLGEPG